MSGVVWLSVADLCVKVGRYEGVWVWSFAVRLAYDWCCMPFRMRFLYGIARILFRYLSLRGAKMTRILTVAFILNMICTTHSCLHCSKEVRRLVR